MRHARDADELFEVPGDELRAIVGDDPWPSLWVLLLGGLGFALRSASRVASSGAQTTLKKAKLERFRSAFGEYTVGGIVGEGGAAANAVICWPGRERCR